MLVIAELTLLALRSLMSFASSSREKDIPALRIRNGNGPETIDISRGGGAIRGTERHLRRIHLIGAMIMSNLRELSKDEIKMVSGGSGNFLVDIFSSPTVAGRRPGEDIFHDEDKVPNIDGTIPPSGLMLF